MTASTVLTTWVRTFQSSDADPRQSVLTFLGEYAPNYDVEQVLVDYVDAIDDLLPVELHLATNGEVYGPWGWDGDASQALREADQAVDFYAIAELYDSADA